MLKKMIISLFLIVTMISVFPIDIVMGTSVESITKTNNYKKTSMCMCYWWVR